MRRGLLVLAACAGAGRCRRRSLAQVPTAEQLELLRSMSPEDREALMEQLGLGGAVIDESPADRGTRSTQPQRRDEREPMRCATRSRSAFDARRRDKTLKPEDSVLIDIDFKKDKPPRIESRRCRACRRHHSGRARAGARARGTSTSCSGSSTWCASRNPYQLDCVGRAAAARVSRPIMLAGLDEEQATHRLVGMIALSASST